MKIIVLNRDLFTEYLTRKGITDANVEEQTKIFFISISNQDDKEKPYFSGGKNVLNMTFADLEKDTEVEIIGEGKELVRAMTQQQAAEMYTFIKANKDKEVVIIHCTAGISRSGAVGVFINDYIGGSYEELRRLNPGIQPNAHVYRLLHDEWYKEIEFNDAITGAKLPIEGEVFEVEVLNPKTPEQLVAEYNVRHPEQHTWMSKMKIDEIREKFGDEIADNVSKRGYQASETELIGARFMHPDSSSTFVKYAAGFDPYKIEFENFWLETNQYYGMVDEQELEVVKELHPDLREIMSAQKKMPLPGELEPFASFGFGDEYGGINLGTWIKLKNMTSFFYETGKVITDKYCKDYIHYGMNGQYFQLPLTRKFKYMDILTCGEGIEPLFVTDKPVYREETHLGDEYWVHTVSIVNNDMTTFYPKKYLSPGIIFRKM